MTDFNIAVHFGERKLTGVAGSMAYMAPEYVCHFPFDPGLIMFSRILMKKGYTYCIDWWSLGVCAYELIFGRRPFRGRSNSDLTYSISRDPLKWPDDADKKCTRNGMLVLKGVSTFSMRNSPKLIFLSLQLLERDPSKRFGCKPNGEGFQELRRHPWFQPIDWDTLDSKEQTPPFTPDVSCHCSCHNSQALIDTMSG